MNPTNEQELDDILKNYAENLVTPTHDDLVDEAVEANKFLLYKAKQAITAHTNAEIAKVLDTIESAVLGEVTDEEERYEVYTAIQAERAKLKEVK